MTSNITTAAVSPYLSQLNRCAEVDRRSSARFVTPLTVREYLALSDTPTRGWPLGGWALLDEHDTVVGYHWHQPYPELDPDWTCLTSAFSAFLPDPPHRIRLQRAGWRIHRNAHDALLDPYLCGTARPWTGS
jgi:hypothetical protein